MDMESSSTSFMVSAAIVFGIIIALVLFGFVISRMYVRATKERAFVRTGLGGQKVVMTGGAIVLPIFHDVMWVNMNTLRLELKREDKESIITKDRLRVDMAVSVFVRVKAEESAVAAAAQTLGSKTLDPEELRAQVEDKCVDVLRAVAAEMEMNTLHEKRAAFVARVQEVVSEDLAKNGLELETVSLTSLNQTRKEFFDANNAFDAEGLAKLTGEIESRRKQRNAIEQDTTVDIERKNLEATQFTLKLKQERAAAEFANELALSNAKNGQTVEIAQVTAKAEQEAREAKIAADQKVREREIESEQLIAQREASKQKEVLTANLAAKTAVEIATQEQAISVAKKSEDESHARAAAEEARAKAVRATEQAETVRATEIANRTKTVQLIEAQLMAEQSAIGVTAEARAQAEAASARADALRQQAQGERDAAVLRAEAITAEGEANASALRSKNEAQNVLDPSWVQQQVRLELIRALPQIIEQAVKPMEKIGSINIAEISGLGGGTSVSAGEGVSANGGLPDQVVSAALRYRAQQPLVDKLMQEVGLTNGLGSLTSLTQDVLNGSGEHQETK